MTTPALGQQASTPLTTLDFTIVGVGIGASPDYQAVPKGITSKVLTTLSVGDVDVAEILKLLPQDYTVRADLSGPAFPTPIHLVTKPGQPFDIPTLAILGKYTLNNIRLSDGSGKTLLGAIPQAVAIDSIPDPIVTSVTTHQLTLAEMQQRGLTFDSSNFTAYEFTAGIATSSGQVPINLPVVIPGSQTIVNPEDIPQPSQIGIVPPAVQVLPPDVPERVVPQNMVIQPFLMRVEEQEGVPTIQLPPIPGVVVIPGNIGFLHQFFSALVLVSNGANIQSGLTIKDVIATIKFPSGADLIPGTDQTPGDDPVRMAKNADGYFPRTQTVFNAGPDGKMGTPDDISFMHPTESGQADFTIEGLKEGTHQLNFDIKATLEGLPIGPVTITGKAMGAVLVRNPDFTLTFGHPQTVRSGEEYDLFITVTNTSQVIANLVSVYLDPRALSGAAFVANETSDKHIDTIKPGSSATVRYRLVSQKTGAVTATAFESEDVKGRFILRTGVGEKGIPLSPDSLILPYTGSLPSDLINAAVGLLGQAWSVATAPTGALPSDILPIGKQIVTNRAYDLSEAGLRNLIGEQTVKAVEALAFDFYGSDVFHQGLDDLRRKSTQGQNLNNALAGIFNREVSAKGAIQFQADYADLVTYRPGHVSVITSEAPVRVKVTDAGNNRIGGLIASEGFREIPYADQLILSDTTGSGGVGQGARSTFSLLTKIEFASYRVDLKAEADADFDLGIVLPDASGTLVQVSFADLSLPAGASAWITLLPGTNSTYILSIDTNNDGTADSTVLSTAVLAIPDRGPQVVAATQLVPGFGPGGDKHGRNVAVLFSERVTTATATNIANYSVEENVVKSAAIQPGGRMAFLLLRDGIGPFYGTRNADNIFQGRSLTVSGLMDLVNNPMSSSTSMPVRITAQGPAAVVEGTVRKANGEPVPNATIKLMQYVWYDDGYTIERRYAIFTEKTADLNGFFHFDYVIQNDDPTGPFMIEATNPLTNEVGQLVTNVAFHGQRMNIDIFMKARGTVTGTVRTSTGSAVANAAIQITTLNDGRIFSSSTDASGAFSFSNLSIGAFNLKAVHQASASQGTVMGTIPDNGSGVVQDIVIYKVADVAKGNVTGKVFAADGVTPKVGVVVVVTAPNYTNWMRTLADGSFSFTNVFAGNVSILARDDASGERTTVTGTVANNGISNFTIIMNGSGMVTGTITRGDGKSAEGLYIIATANGLKWVVQTDLNAQFSFDSLPVGDITIEALDPRDFNRTIASGAVTLLAAGDRQDISLFAADNSLATGTIQGTVYKRDGSIWSGADVRLIKDSYSYYTYKADGQGKYSIVQPLGTYRLAVVSGSSVANGTATLWYGSQIKPLDLRPVGIGTVSGTIYDDAARTIPTGADVTLVSTKPNEVGWLVYETRFPTVVKSDPVTGRYTFNGILAGSFTVSSSNVFRPVSVSQGDSITSDAQTVTIDLSLKGSPPPPPDPGGGTTPPPPPPTNTMGWVSGIVYQPDGKTPVGENVHVTVNYGGGVTLSTSPTGTFLSGQIIPAGNYCLTAEDLITTLKGRSCVYVPTGQNVSATIRLLGRGALTVRTLTAGSEIAPNIAVSINGSSFPNDSASGVTDPITGEITFLNLSEGSYAISARDTIHGLGGTTQATIPSDNSIVSIDVRLAAAGIVTGRFLKPDGATPIGGGQVKLIRSGQAVAYAVTSSAAADLGTFRMEYVTMGDFTLEAYDPTTERTGKGGGRLSTNGETVTTDVIVTPRGSVKGIVLNNSGSAPIANASVSISVTGVAGYNYSTTTGPDGSFMFTGVPAGKYAIDARDPSNGLHGNVSGTITYENEISQASVRIAPTGSIEGVVYLPNGVTPAKTAYVQFSNGSNRVQVNPLDGTFSYTNLAAGPGNSYSFFSSEANTHRVGKTTVSLTTDGQVAGAAIILRGVGTVTGLVLNNPDEQLPVAGLAVTMNAVGLENATSNVDTRYTGADGRFQFTDVPIGTFTIQTFDPVLGVGDSASGSLTKEGEEMIANLILASVANVTGKVYKADSVTPAAGGGVRYTGCGKTYLRVIDTQGRFLFQNILVPCANFTLYMEDAEGIGIGWSGGSLTSANSGTTVDVGTVILDDKAIAVTSVTPITGSVNVPINTTIHIAFSEKAKASTVTSSNIYLKKDTAVIAGTLVLDADGMGVTFTPSQPLIGMTLYTIYATTGVTDLVGRPLVQTFTSAFTTVDSTPPAITFSSPAQNATNVAQDGVVRITFTEAIDPSFTSDIKLLLYGTQVNARLDLVQSGTVAILTPTGGLLTDTVYTISVSGVKDLVGNLLLGTYSSSFMTLDTLAPNVNSLTIPANADLIKGNTISVTAATDADTAFVDFFVDGKLAFTDNTSPFVYLLPLTKEGSIVIKAVAQDAAGNRNPNIPWAKELALNVLVDTPPSMSITSPVEGSLVNTNAAVSVGVTATDDLLVSSITMTAVMNGQTLLDQTKTSATGKTFSPAFSFTVPLTAAPGSSIIITAIATDSNGQTSAISQKTIIVKDGTVPAITTLTSPGIANKYKPGDMGAATITATDNIGVASVTCAASGAATGSQTFTIDPTALSTSLTFPFQVNANAAPYASFTISCTAKDAAQNASNATIIAMQAADVVPPAVSSTNIANNATNIQAKPTVSAIFSETVLLSSLTATSVILTADNGSVVAGTISLSGDHKTVSFLPTQNLVKATLYRFLITTAVKDDAGNGLAADYSLSFTTDGTPPTLVSASLTNNATNIQARPALSATFSEPLLTSTVNAASVKLTADSGVAVAGAVSLSTDRKTVTFTLSQDLAKATRYSLVVTSAVTDDIGNAVTGDPVLSFTTDNTAPAMTSITPANGAQNVALGIAVVVNFAEAINPNTMTPDRFIVSSSTGTVSGTLTLNVNNTMVTFAPSSPMSFTTDYTVTLKPGIADVMGNVTTSDIVSTFRTGSYGDQLRVVYYDTRYPFSWITRAKALIYKNFLVANGFTAMNADELKTFMQGNGVGSLVVMAQDIMPDTVADVQNSGAIVRKYLDAGGTLVWMQEVPFYFVGSATGAITTWNAAGGQNVLGITWSSSSCGDVDVFKDGSAIGIATRWTSCRPVSSSQVSITYTGTNSGAAAWLKNYNAAYPQTGFIRLWDNTGDYTSKAYLEDLITVLGLNHGDVKYPDLVAQYHMDNDWNDASGNGNTGTGVNLGSQAFNITDKIAGASSGNFKAASDYVKIGNLYGNFPDYAFTIEAWVKLDDTGNGSRRTIAGGMGASKDYEIGLLNNQFMVQVGNGSTSTYAYSGVTPVVGANAAWYHVVGTYDGTTLRIYVNGELKNQTAATWAQPSTGADFWIGQEYCCSVNLNGLIDEVSVYRRDLPAEDILEHYNAGISSDRLAPLPPVVNTVISPTYQNVIILSGTKDFDASVRINGKQLVGIDGSTTWSVSYMLQLGQNNLHITSRDAAGNESPEVLTTIELAPAKGADPDVVGLWHFDGNWKDFSGNSNHGYAYNGPLFSSDAKVGTSAASFDGVNDYVRIMIDTPEQNFTIEMWAKTDTSGGLLSVNAGSFSGSGGNDRHIYISNSGNACFRVYNGSTWCSSAKVNDNIWHHWMFVVETGAGQKFYLDGVLVGTNAYDHSDFTTQDRITIGYSADKGYFKGLIDEVRILKRAVHADEVRLRFDATDSNVTPPASPTVDSIPATTNNNSIALSGTKEADTAVWINNREVYPKDSGSSWQATYSLDPGVNTLSVYARNAAGQLSVPTVVTIEVVQGKAVDSDLVALWHFDNTWSDYSGNNNHLVPFSPNIDGATFTSDAKVGANAAVFDGVNDYAEAAANTSLSIGGQSWTVSTWIKTSTVNSSIMSVLTRNSGGNALSQLYLDETGFATFLLRSDNGVMLKLSDTKEIRDGAWHLLTGILDRGNRVMRIYVDGQERGVIAASDLNTITDISSTLVVGAAKSGTTYSTYFKGQIDETAVYKRALLGDEVSEMFIAGTTLDRIAPTKPTVNAVASPTTQNNVLISGTKDAGSSVRINNVQAVGLDQSTNWQTQFSLPQLGDNVLSITSRDSAGNLSEPATLTINLQSATQDDSTIVGLWHFDNTGNDYSGNNNHLTLKNTASFSLDSANGDNSLNLNGTDDYLEKTSPSSVLSIESLSWTVSAWIKTTAQNTDSMMILERYECGWNNCAAADGNTNAWYKLFVDTGGKATFYVRSDDGNAATAVDTQDLRDGKWHYVAGELDRSLGKVKIYVDGVERSAVAGSAIGTIKDAGSPLEIGRHQYGNQTGHTPQYFKGLIDEVNIYKRAVPAADVWSKYVTGKGSQLRPAAPTVNTITTPRADHIVTLSGTKAADTSIWVNGVELVSNDSAQVWESVYVLQPGVNILRVTVKDEAGIESDPTALSIEVLGAKLTDADIVGLWHMDGNWYDYSGNGNTLTPVNYADFTAEAQVGPAAGMFNASSSNRYSRRSTGTGLPLGNSPRTFAAWIKPYSYPDATFNGIIAYGPMTCTGKGSGLSIKNDGRIAMSFWCDDATQTVGPSVALNQWNHVAFTYDGGTKIRFYMNGRFIQEATIASVPNTSDGPIRIGSTDDPGRVFNGLIDEAIIYKRSLTDLDMEKLYNQGAGRVGVWHMNDTWEDSSGNNNNGVLHNNVTFQPNSRVGTSVGSFDGADDYVNGYASVLPSGNAPRTVSAWVKPSNGTQNRAVIEYGKGSGAISTGDFRVFIDGANLAAVGTGFGSNSVRSTSRIDDGKWHHITGVYEGVDTNTVRVYVDGVLENSGTITAPETTDANYSIGSFLAGGGYFNGLLDEVDVYNYALTNYEIEKHFNEDLGRVGYWPMDNTWEDKSRNGNDGTTGNGATFTTDAKIGTYAGSFDGVDDYVTVGTDADMLFTGPHTLESWVKFSGFPTQWVPISIVQQYRYGLWYDSTSKMIRAHRDSGSTINSLDVYTSLTTNTWYHFVQVFDGTELYVYVNGQLLARGPGVTSTNSNSSNSAMFGRGWNTSDSGKLQGAMDAVSVYNRALMADEILDNYNAVVSGGAMPASPHVNPVASSTTDNTIALSGTKEVGTSVWINGVLVVPVDNSTSWYTTYSLLPSANTVYVSTQSSSGSVSDPIPVAVTVQSANLQNADLVGLWHMDGNWMDYSGNGNHGSASGGATFNCNHMAGTMSASFNGSSSYVEVKNTSQINPSLITVGAWVKSNTTTWNNYGFLLSKRDAYILHPQSGSKEITFYIFSSGNWRSVTYNDPGLNITDWHYYAATYDGNTIKLFIDGVLKSSTVYAGAISTSDTGSMFIGWDDGQSGRYFNGLIDEVALYKRALTTEEIEASYHKGLGRVGVWHMENNWNDSSASLSNGSAYGNPTFAASSRASSTATAFDGIDDYVTGNAAKLPFGDMPRSISAWVKTDKSTQKRIILDYGAALNASAPGDYALYIDELNRVAMSSGSAVVSGISLVADGKWHFVTAAYEGSITNIVKIYVDGSLDGLGTISTPNTIAGDYAIGRSLEPNGYFNGLMDELIVYNRTTTAEEINKYYNSDMGRVAYWRMDTDWLDSSGNNNNATTSGATISPDAKIGAGAGYFDGASNYAQITGNYNLKPAAVTVGAWVKMTSAPASGGVIFDNESASPWYGYELYVFGNKLRADIYSSSGLTIQGTTSLQLNTWYHVAMTYDNYNFKIYLNGLEEGSLQTTGPLNYAVSVTPTIGKRSIANTMYFPGVIDDIAVYSRALSSTEIREHYNADNGGTLPATPYIYSTPTTTTANSITLSGTKETGTSIWINGMLTVPSDTSTSWSAAYALQPGANIIMVWSRNSSGSLSEPATVIVNVPPVVVSASVQNNSSTVSSNAPVSVVFSEPIASSSATTNSVILVRDDGTNTPVAGAVTLSTDRKTVIFTQTAELVKGAKYKFTITAAVKDDAGNALAADYVLQFTTSYGLLEIKNQSSYTIAAGGYFDIVITNSTVKTSGDISSSTLSMTGSTLITKGAVRATSLSVTSYSVLTHEYASTTESWKLDVTATTLSIDSTSKIDVSGRGYLGGWQGGNSYIGRTFGNTAANGSGTNNGGSYGGLGGIYSGGVNAMYGDLMNPNEAGSGGSGASSTGYSCYPGGNGGGLVRITAGSALVNGSILADGSGVCYGGGSGGGITINTGTLSGTGTIRAQGGASSSGYGAGGGGRIAVYYTDKTGYAGTITVKGGSSDSVGENGGAGTVYLKSSTNTYGDLIIDNATMDSREGSTSLPAVGQGMVTAITGISLTNSNVAWIPGVLKGLKFNPNTSQNRTFTIVNNDAATLYIDPAEGDLTQVASVGSQYTGIYTLNQMTISGKARVFLSDRLVVGNELVVDASSLHTDNNDVTADKITIKNGGYINHLGTTTTTTYKVVLNATTSLTIDSLSKIDVSGRGYLGGWQGGNSYIGRTFGNTATNGSGANNGGSYGGLGGVYSGGVNAVYGDLMNPNEVGSGGGGASSTGYSCYPGGNGGGLVRITAGSALVNGSILADGSGVCYGGGSGGGITINTGTLSGTGTIRAQGGASSSSNGAGGGGRIAVYYTDKTGYAGTVDANGGSSSSGRRGGAGTVYWKSASSFFGEIVINNKDVMDVATTLPSGRYGDITVTNSTVVFDGGVTAENIILKNGSVLTHPYTGTTGMSQLDVTATTLSIDSTSKIDVSGRGYLGGWQGGNSYIGRTFGNTAANGSGTNNGGSYGGLGGIYSGGVNAMYGDLMNPNEAGSGGSGASSTGYSCYPGGNGGGLVRITAGSALVNGSILADGSGVCYGGGSGGGITINTGTLSGTGTIRAQGGASSSGYGAGGGGRIAVYYTDKTGYAGTITVKGGSSDSVGENGGAGTVYLKSSTNTYGDLIIDNATMDSREGSTSLPAVGQGMVTAITGISLTNSNVAWIPGVLKGLKFNPNTSQNRTFTIVNNDAATLYIDPAEGDLTQVASVGSQYTGIYTLNQMTISGKARVFLSDRLVVGNELVVDASSLHTDNNDVTADKITIKNGGYINHLGTTTTTTYKVVLNATTSLTIDSLSKIDVSGRGYLGGWQGGNSYIGRTFGNTATNGSGANNGGSYGGLGGVYSGGVNAVYGDLMNPNEVGSGGGGASSTGYSCYPGGNGGGLVRITAGSALVNGSILADGSGVCYGGGSGGGITINTGTLSGTGTIRAQGGASSSSNGAGGGGRIAVYYSILSLPTANISTSGGLSGSGTVTSRNGWPGTVHIELRP